MNLYSPAQELKAMRRGLRVADERAVDVDVNVHPTAIIDPQCLRCVSLFFCHPESVPGVSLLFAHSFPVMRKSFPVIFHDEFR
jgi:hypothetical protein